MIIHFNSVLAFMDKNNDEKAIKAIYSTWHAPAIRAMIEGVLMVKNRADVCNMIAFAACYGKDLSEIIEAQGEQIKTLEAQLLAAMEANHGRAN